MHVEGKWGSDELTIKSIFYNYLQEIKNSEISKSMAEHMKLRWEQLGYDTQKKTNFEIFPKGSKQ